MWIISVIPIVAAVLGAAMFTACDSAPIEETNRSSWSEAGGRSSRELAGTSAPEGPAETMAPAAMINAPTTIFVRDFQVAHPSSSADSGGRPRLLPGILRGVRTDMSQSQLVGKLSAKVAEELVVRGFRAERLAGGSLPARGWLVQGTFVEFVQPDGNFVTDRWAKQDVELTIVIDDLVRGTPRTLTDFTVIGAASGEGAPMMPNPYAAGAKFVVRQAELEGDAGALASRIADAIARFAQSEHVLPGPARR